MATTRPTKYTLVDFFCGCGGISRGFEWTGRFGSQMGVEIQPHPAGAFTANSRDTRGLPSRIFCGDVRQLVAQPTTLWSVLKDAGIHKPGGLDVLAGGPPCQGFSRNAPRLYTNARSRVRFYDDPRNHLYKAFLTAVEILRPKLVLVENVREFLNFAGGQFSSDLLTRFTELEYEVGYQKLCAADYGVPQMRHRVFFIAVRKDVADATGMGPAFPPTCFGRQEAGFLFKEASPYRTVRDAIFDLPSPSDDRRTPLKYGHRSKLSDLARQLRNPSGHVTNHFTRELSGKQVARINAVGSGRMRDVDQKLQTRAFYGSAYRRLAWDEPALTITTWVYHVGSGRFAHPSEDRAITMREAARLQSFDDAFVFPPLVNPVSQMIGNAVPPLLASHFANQFLKVLDEFTDE